MATTRNAWLGPAARPVFVLDDEEDPADVKATGQVKLPMHIRWSEPSIVYDLDDRCDRARVYEQVLREGTKDDVRFFIQADRLLDLWDELVLPVYVRRAWAEWFRKARGVQLAC
jgi:hypothetical protein